MSHHIGTCMFPNRSQVEKFQTLLESLSEAMFSNLLLARSECVIYRLLQQLMKIIVSTHL